ncbi:MAG: NadS family protein [Pseudomonadota bacterium]|jgi:putative transcriptional regulator|uniref:NadS family protein n=1 Tax=Alteromonas oceani TaxID=2071609 RepID=A0ABV7K065_9ALTE|nr:NadS family protein [Alteromonas oceani]MAD09558.1 transcriptional regulator [Alteromonas sp.]MAJ68306.1 transcriptional regulator [Alteromonadaceae bacterium]MEC9262641.1 NadS family protein [Pseudomonadota bacterium]HAU93960.1 transcriptional regulator [Alteromonas sp.]HCA78042.1 transcriptional regulator [Alteromonas sp.]|tara:strand:- start:4053 stop:4343 length:291 start_codon:yes stop_codon:yes gene_type:complete
MNGDMFEQLIESVTQADDIIKGKAKPFRATEFAEPQVKAIRAKTGLSQTRFADVLGVSKRTLENWEQGRRHPTGPARALLKILDADPKHAMEVLNH